MILFVLGCVDPEVRKAPTTDDTDTDVQQNDDDDDDVIEDDDDDDDTDSDVGPCPPHMALVNETFCIDRYEAWVDGHSPYAVATGDPGPARTGPGEVPQGYITGQAAASACEAAGKQLCTLSEWLAACQGPAGRIYPYGDTYDANACNDTRGSHPVVDLFGSATDWSPTQMNDPRINQQADSLDRGGDNPDCVTPDGVFDLHGNLHEWVDDPAGTFKGGFYADAVINGPGCTYTTTAHSFGYHDYSTGFRCCASPVR